MSATTGAPPTVSGSGRTGEGSLLATARGKRLLALLCAVAFLDFIDASITNVALPHIRSALHLSTQNLQWVPSGYLLTYGGLMLLGGRLADLLGRRNVLLAGTALVALGSTVGGFSHNSGLFIAARLVQGAGAALMLPAALSTLTTSFTDEKDRTKALGVWGGVAGLASAAGILAGGLLVEGPGWRWVMFVNPIAILFLVPAVLRILPRGRGSATTKRFDLPGAALVTGGMLLLVLTLVRAPVQGWGKGTTWLEFGGAAALLVVFLIREQFAGEPLLPLDCVPDSWSGRGQHHRARRLRGDARDVLLPDAVHADGARLLAVRGRRRLPAAHLRRRNRGRHRRKGDRAVRDPPGDLRGRAVSRRAGCSTSRTYLCTAAT